MTAKIIQFIPRPRNTKTIPIMSSRGETAPSTHKLPLHLLTQRNQPFGSRRQCCEWCGLSMYEPGFRATDNNELWWGKSDTCRSQDKEPA